ncbi:hypothetical protein AGABI1DRAFT_89577 [Agaricus bisporus var. burnettii JB137-S8]|uniref:Uncharacterized protein n=1 Tax=Agaricus bisporus var. burnettii (strain JB137-S8 / ATCC MYA-4627 / FGSC 10392) TaxID=597362 RepID=K5X4X7_AGABU|nr:uncharacterized protein AGABI1DRAFT_89577 [Agaricus bisporus var. burnettii JB137-S8]EKM82916.1 hypothetical protein AGABI1DRAFT_89577 [Agaricus bisporus var. burnettii JB137-S8]
MRIYLKLHKLPKEEIDPEKSGQEGYDSSQGSRNGKWGENDEKYPQIQGSSYHIQSCFKGNSWYEITDKAIWYFQVIFKVAHGSNHIKESKPQTRRHSSLVLWEYRVRFFPKEPYKSCQCDLKSPETRQHLLMVCPLFVRRINHYDLDGITTIRGLILFLQDNPQVFSFEPPELPLHADESWLAYRKEVELVRDAENKRRKKKRLPPLVRPIFLHESIEFVRHWNIWGDR